MSLKLKIATAFSLGVFNLLRVFNYRLGVKTGLNPVHKLKAQMPSGNFFAEAQHHAGLKPEMQFQTLTAFGYLEYPIQGGSPNWFYSPLTQKTFQDVKKPWYQIPDFDASVGDIKGIWEASRFDWLLMLVNQFRQQKNNNALAQLDAWLNDWCQHNQPYLGPNWKCGQEASIRVMHVIAALIALNQLDSPNSTITSLITLHLQRIAPTIDYAIAQDNNHGTSEATALFIGGALLDKLQPSLQHKKWRNTGRKWLENRARKLIMQDGGFSQYSVNYHRVMLDSYSLAEIVRQRLNLKEFSGVLYQQLKKATDWLYVVAQSNGDAPNLGANDGARLLPVTHTDYRDFRPNVQLASTLFQSHSFYQEAGAYDEVIDFLGITKKTKLDFVLPDKNQNFNKSGLITAQQGLFFTAFKLPVFKFRPSQSDALHLDVWWNGQNILRDGGTYSYNSTGEDLEYFSGVASHNTVQFDQHQQMPRLSRFLLGAWLKPQNFRYKPDHFECGYKDYWGCIQHRKIALSEKEVRVSDKVSGFKTQAVLRWRLVSEHWILEKNILTNGKISMEIVSDTPVSIYMSTGQESRYYYQKTQLPVLEIVTHEPATILTIIKDIT